MRRWTLTLGMAAALGVAALGVTGALAQSDTATEGTSPDALLERLAALEQSLPDEVPPSTVSIDPEETWGELRGDAGSVGVVLTTLEQDLRRLFVDADEAAGSQDPELDVARAVASVARGWLDVWHGTTALGVAESNDLAFPVDTFDDTGVATGRDELRGEVEIGLELVLLGHERHLAGYVGLRVLGAAPPAAQARFDARAADAEAFDRDLRPALLALMSQPTASVSVPTERFVTDAPGVEPRARSYRALCVDRDALDEAGGVATPEVLAGLEPHERDRPDC